jgi:DNA-binding response OmpR family regulator
MEKLRVMIVDDDDVFLDELYEVLSLSGYDTFSFREGGAALKWALQARPDLILLDIKMDGIDGFQLSKELKRHAETAGIPVISMTGHFMEEHHLSMMRACGMETCLKKPFNALNLLKRIAMVLDLKGRGKVKGSGRRSGGG